MSENFTEYNSGFRDPASPPLWKKEADNEILRLSGFKLFSPTEPLDRDWLEEEAKKLQEGVGLSSLPIHFFTDIKDANKFAIAHKDNPEWRNVWGTLRDQARAAIPTDLYAQTWGIVRRGAEQAFATAGSYGQVGKDAQNRAGSYVQWIGVQETLGPNKMRPFMDVYEKGGALVGRSSKEFAVLAPPAKQS